MCNELLTRKELAAKLKVHIMTIYRWVEEGMPVLIHEPARYDFEDVMTWLQARHTKKPGPKPKDGGDNE